MQAGREIKFRGKPIEDYGDIQWFYGSAVLDYEEKLAYIVSPGQGHVPVEWESIGQFTGLRDSTKWEQLTEDERSEWTRKGNFPSEWNGKEIYEGDELFSMNAGEQELGRVVYDTNQAMFQVVTNDTVWSLYEFIDSTTEIICTIYEKAIGECVNCKEQKKLLPLEDEQGICDDCAQTMNDMAP